MSVIKVGLGVMTLCVAKYRNYYAQIIIVGTSVHANMYKYIHSYPIVCMYTCSVHMLFYFVI